MQNISVQFNPKNTLRQSLDHPQEQTSEEQPGQCSEVNRRVKRALRLREGRVAQQTLVTIQKEEDSAVYTHLQKKKKDSCKDQDSWTGRMVV